MKALALLPLTFFTLLAAGCLEDDQLHAENFHDDVTPAPDSDGDGVVDGDDNCPLVANPDQDDVDGDWFGDACDTCVVVFDPEQADEDSDGHGDACPEEDDIIQAFPIPLPPSDGEPIP